MHRTPGGTSIFLRQTSESKVEDLPAFLQHFSEARPLSVLPHKSESRPRAVMKNGCAREEMFFFLYLYHVGHCNVDFFFCSYTLDYIATLFRSTIYVLHGLAVRAIQCKVVLFGFGLVC